MTHPDQHTGPAKEHDAAKALEEYQKSITYPARLARPKELSPCTPGATQLLTERVIYSSDTPEDTKHRPQAFWARGNTSHDPDSPHACPSEEGYWDTSYFNDWHYAISQCRILLCHYDLTSLRLMYRDLNAGPD